MPSAWFATAILHDERVELDEQAARRLSGCDAGALNYSDSVLAVPPLADHGSHEEFVSVPVADQLPLIQEVGEEGCGTDRHRQQPELRASQDNGVRSDELSPEHERDEVRFLRRCGQASARLVDPCA